MCILGRPVSDRTFFLACLGVFAAGSLASWGRVYALAMATAGVAERLRTRLFAALLLQEKEFFDEKKAGELAPILAEVLMLRSVLLSEAVICFALGGGGCFSKKNQVEATIVCTLWAHIKATRFCSSSRLQVVQCQDLRVGGVVLGCFQ